jgi:hypothetical protein
MLKVEVVLGEEQIKECFENADVKFSKKKMKTILENVEFSEMDIKERLEESLMEILEEIITEELIL